MSFRISLLVVASWIESLFVRLVEVRPRLVDVRPRASFMTAMPQATVRQRCTEQKKKVFLKQFFQKEKVGPIILNTKLSDMQFVQDEHPQFFQ